MGLTNTICDSLILGHKGAVLNPLPPSGEEIIFEGETDLLTFEGETETITFEN